MSARALVVSLFLGCLGLLTMACGDDAADPVPAPPPPPCNTAPQTSCGAGQVCWIQTSLAYACVAAQAGVGNGAECRNTIGAASCDEGLACYQKQGAPAGTCVPFCAPDNACVEAGERCGELLLAGSAARISVCITP